MITLVVAIHSSHLAGPTECGSLSDTQPFPIGVAKKGKFVALMKALIFSAAPLEKAAPLPTITSGLLAFKAQLMRQ